jgi:hypothetical protein
MPIALLISLLGAAIFTTQLLLIPSNFLEWLYIPNRLLLLGGLLLMAWCLGD